MSSTVSNFMMLVVGTGLAIAVYILYKKNYKGDFNPQLPDLFPGVYGGSTINELETKVGESENFHIKEARNRAVNTIRRRIAEIADVPTDSFKVVSDIDMLSKFKDHLSCPGGVIYDTVQTLMYDPDIGDPLRGIGSVIKYEEHALIGAKAYILWSGLGASSNIDLTDVC